MSVRLSGQFYKRFARTCLTPDGGSLYFPSLLLLIARRSSHLLNMSVRKEYECPPAPFVPFSHGENFRDGNTF